VAKSLQQHGEQLQGIRIDSGDLAYLSQQCRQELDKHGLTDVKIAVSNQLDEYVIKSLQEQNAPIDVYGVGTNLVIGHPDAALDGVYKLAYANQKPRLKLSENIAKSTLPHQKQVYRLRDQNQQLIGANLIAKAEEHPDFNQMHHPFDLTKTMPLDQLKFEALLQPVMLNGKRQQAPKPLVDIKQFAEQQLAELPAEYKRFTNPHLYKVGLSTALLEAREQLRTTYKS
jgi:nicotinate phosphoribosyltransferase